MKCMERNKVRFFYSLYQSKEMVKDEDGNLTGEYKILRSAPIECWANVSAAKGETETRQFGESEAYDKVIAIDNVSAPLLDEYSVLWIDSVPTYEDTEILAVDVKDAVLTTDEDGNTVLLTKDTQELITPYDYIVKKVATSLNSTLIAIKKVNVS